MASAQWRKVAVGVGGVWNQTGPGAARGGWEVGSATDKTVFPGQNPAVLQEGGRCQALLALWGALWVGFLGMTLVLKLREAALGGSQPGASANTQQGRDT